jgi:hypothetical protein
VKGTIATRVTAGGGINQLTGEPIPVTFIWTEEIECRYTPVQNSNQGRYTDGTFKQASYTITTGRMDFAAQLLRLTNSRGQVAYEGEIISIEVLEDIQRVKIIV